MKTALRSGPALLLFSVLIFFGGLWSAITLPLQTDLLSLFPTHLTSLNQLKSFQKEAAAAHQVVLVRPPEGSWTDESWDRFIEHFSSEAEKSLTLATPQTGPPPQMARGLALHLASLPAESFQRVRDHLNPEALQVRARQEQESKRGAIDERLLSQFLMDPFGILEAGNFNTESLPPENHSFLVLTTPRPLEDFNECQALEKSLRATIRSSLLAASLESEIHPVLITGEAIFTSQISTHMQRDLILMLVFTITLVLLLFAAVYRSWRPLIWILFVQVLAISSALMVARFFLGGLNVITMGFASILMGVSLDYCILVYHHFARGETLDSDAWKTLTRGIWFSAIATSSAFAVLWFSRFPGLQQLAALVATGLLASAGFSTTLLAWALHRRPPHQPPRLDCLPQFWGTWLESNARRFLLGILIITGLLTIGILTFSKAPLYDDDITRLQPSSLEAYRAHSILKSQLPSAESLPIPQASNRVKWTPLSPLAWESIHASTSPAAPLFRETLRLLDQWSQHPEALGQRPPGAEVWEQLRHDLDRVAVEDFKTLSIFMLLLMGGISAAAHRSARLVGMNLLALVLALGALILSLKILALPFTLVSLVCIPLLIGVVLDYSIHLLLGLEHEGRSLPRAFQHLLIPIAMTGMTSLIGFTAPALSSQPALINFGLVMDLGILCAMITVLGLLPALYALTRPSSAPHYSKTLYTAVFFEGAARLASILPRSALRGIGAGIASCYAWTHPDKCALVQKNIQVLFPKGTAAPEAWKVYSRFGSTIADYFYAGSLPLEKSLHLLKERVGYEHLQSVHQQGRGGLIVTSHLSLFELGGMLLTSFNFASTALTIPEPTPELTEWRAKFRRRWGVETTEVGQDSFSSLAILNAFRENRFVIALIDRPLARYNSPVAFPGGTIPFASGILLLAAVAQCPVLVATIHETEDHFYRAEVHPPFLIQPQGSREETLGHYAGQIGKTLLPILQKNPTQWFQFSDWNQETQ